MDHSVKTGVSFGLTSGIITTLGLMVGLNSGTQSRIAVIGGVLTIAVADALSDALGIHISEESENKHTAKEIWASTFSTFISKFAIAITFIIPVLMLNLPTAIIVSIIWGLSLLSIMTFRMARSQKKKPFNMIAEHLAIAAVVIIATHFVGMFVSNFF